MTSYVYLEPTIRTKSAISGILFIIVITYIIMQYIHIYLNWSNKSVQCKLDNLYITYFTGNISKWWKKCAPNKCAPNKFTPNKFVLKKFAPNKFTPKKFTSNKFTPKKFTPKKFTSNKFTSKKITPKK